MSAKRFAILGTGFWARYQLSAWRELGGAACVALYNRTRHKADALAREFAIPAVYDDPRVLMARENLDFVDIITDVNTHADLVHAAAEQGIPVICQKPMAPTLAQAEAMVGACRAAHVPMFVHENWRWQTPIRALKTMLGADPIGRVHRATITMVSGFPVSGNAWMNKSNITFNHRYIVGIKLQNNDILTPLNICFLFTFFRNWTWTDSQTTSTQASTIKWNKLRRKKPAIPESTVRHSISQTSSPMSPAEIK